MNISRAKGTKDIFFDDMKIWQYVEENIKEICIKHNIDQIRTPIFEDTTLFSRSVGDETDIVNKEMYTFLDKGNRSITLRPELTAGVVRAYIENGFSSMLTPIKLWYIGTMYRYEKMQKGRYREFSQFGIEVFGSDSYLADIEVISVAYELFKKLRISDKIALKINSIGCSKCRAKYIDTLKEYLVDKIDNMCDDCKIRYVKNPMRIIDCKQDKCKSAKQNLPMITDYLCDDCSKDFESLKQTLFDVGIEYEIDKTIVRGLDYYNKTVFEFISKDLGLAVGGGGRYDTLVEVLGGTHTPAIGFGLGMDRIILLLKEYELVKNNRNVDIYFIIFDSNIFPKVFKLTNDLRDLGYIIDIDICNRSFNAQLKYASKIKARYICIIGEDELKENLCGLKNMNTSEQIKVDMSAEEIGNILK
ncbi:MAG: histidine--tRNA ligase [Clostridia bacterium]|nr:histidine--tRNA ligase [Clostridia bacterium]MDD4386600.1 histidine--tRNA ligase [Clostridia bacterium]